MAKRTRIKNQGQAGTRLDSGFAEEDLRAMAGRLGHTIRNPLSTIKAAAQLIRRLDLSGANAEPHLDSIVAEVARIDTAVRRMETYLDIAAPQVAKVQVGEAVADAVSGLAGRARDGDVELVVEPGPAASVEVDPAHLTLALAELIANAISASPRGSKVAVSWEAERSGELSLHVDDHGPGIPPEQLPGSMRHFSSSHGEGSGLGLNIAQRVSCLASGRLEYRSRPGGGSRFTLVLAGG